MLSFSGSLKVFVGVEPCDMRRSFNGLHDAVSTRLQEDPRSESIYAFTNKRRTMLKILYWDGSGLWVLAKSHAPQCAYRFVFENPLSVPSALREGLRVLRFGWRQEGHGLRAACRPVDPRRARVDVRSGGLFRRESG